MIAVIFGNVSCVRCGAKIQLTDVDYFHELAVCPACIRCGYGGICGECILYNKMTNSCTYEGIGCNKDMLCFSSKVKWGVFQIKEVF